MSRIRLAILIAPSVAFLVAILFDVIPYDDSRLKHTTNDVGAQTRLDSVDEPRSQVPAHASVIGPRRGNEARDNPTKQPRFRTAVANEPSNSLPAAYRPEKNAPLSEIRRDMGATPDLIFKDLLFDQGPVALEESEREAGLAGVIDPGSLSDDAEPMDSVFRVMDRFVNPLDKWICTAAFGAGGSKGFHQGLDMAASSGATVYAIGDGKVVYAGALPQFQAYGKVVVIDHGCGVFSLYGHVTPLKRLEDRKRKIGERWSYIPVFVDSGFKIATLSGKKRRGESTTGPHLHLEIMVVRKSEDRLLFTFHNPAHCLPLDEKRWMRPLLPEVYATRIEERKLISRGRNTLKAAKLRGLRALLDTIAYPFEPERGDYLGLVAASHHLLSGADELDPWDFCPGDCENMLHALATERRDKINPLSVNRLETNEKPDPEKNTLTKNIPAQIERDYPVSSYMRLEEALSNSIDLRIGVASAEPFYNQ